jgi:hypothetical protein
MSTPPSISIDSLSVQAANDLCRALTAVGAKAEREPVMGRKYGNATLVNVVTAMIPGLLGIILALVAKGRKDSKSGSSVKFRRLESDGTFTEYEFVTSAEERASDQLSPESVKKIAELSDLSVDKVLAAISGKG